MADIVDTLRDGCDCGSAKAECPAKEACQDAFDAADEIERLREALRTIANTPAWGYPDKWEDTPTELRHFARAALGEKE